eukprot:1149472-Pelagomonas_calceolata.AAC.7
MAACITQTKVRPALGREETRSRIWQYSTDRKLNHERGNLEDFTGGRMDRQRLFRPALPLDPGHYKVGCNVDGVEQQQRCNLHHHTGESALTSP